MANNRWNERSRRWEYSDEDEGQDMNRNFDYDRNRYRQRRGSFNYNAGDYNRDPYGNYDRNNYSDQGENFNQGYYDQGPYGYNRNMRSGGYNRGNMNEYNRGYYDEGYGGWNDMGTSRGPNWQNRFNQGRYGNQGWDQTGYSYNQGRNRFGMQNQRRYGSNQGMYQGSSGNQGWNQGDYGYNQGMNRSGYQGQPDYDYDLETDYLDTEMPETWTYTEYWLIPGPFTGIGPENYQRSDDRISDDICDRLTQHGKLDASDIHVDVKDGEVTLTGNVKDRNQKRMAEDVVESVFGVCDVHNQLKVQKSGGMQAQSQSKQQTQNQTK